MGEKIGAKIRQLRESANVTIEEAALAAGIDVSQMARIETGEIAASMSTLIKIARRIGIRVGTILDGGENPGPAITRRDEQVPSISTSNANTAAREHLNFFALAARKTDRNMEPYIVEVEYVEPSKENMSHHEGEEFFYVFEGKVEFRYGAHSYTLGPGDTIYYDSIVPHCVTTPAPGDKARILAIVYIPY